MHRYRPDLMATIRVSYVHPQQERIDNRIAVRTTDLELAGGRGKAAISKELKRLNDQRSELIKFEQKLQHLANQMIDIDLDDGVKVNYAKLQDVLAKIK